MEVKAKDIVVVILAAGEGKRLCTSQSSPPKPLTRLLGLTLLERSIYSCVEAGFSKFVVVTGHRSEEVANFAISLAKKKNISITIAFNEKWELGNGSSLLACADYVSSPFITVMCDHLFDPQILKMLVSKAGAYSCSLIAVDKFLTRVFDPEDATYVKLEDSRLVDIGKQLKSAHAVDTGFFLFTPAIFQSLKKAIEKGDGSLSAGVKELALSQGVFAVDISGLFWLDIDTPHAIRHAQKTLLSRTIRAGHDGYISTLINRRISTRISAWLSSLPISPNVISVSVFTLALIASALFAIGSYAYAVAGGLIAQFSSILDGCDGEVAIVKFQRSKFGAWFDTMLDRYADTTLAMAITYGYYLEHPNIYSWVIGAVSALGFIMVSYMHKEYRIRFGEELDGSSMRKLIKRDLRIFVIFLGALLNLQFFFLALIGFFSHFAVIWFLIRKHTELAGHK